MSSGLVFMVGGTPLCCYDSGHLVQYNQYANRLILIQGQKGQVPALITVSTKASSSSSKEELLCELFLKGEREREKSMARPAAPNSMSCQTKNIFPILNGPTHPSTKRGGPLVWHYMSLGLSKSNSPLVHGCLYLPSLFDFLGHGPNEARP